MSHALHRTSDHHAVKWEAFDVAAGAFEWGYAPRKKGSRLAKGGKPQLLTVPEMLRPVLRDSWERHGKPSSGLIFPKRRAPGSGPSVGTRATRRGSAPICVACSGSTNRRSCRARKFPTGEPRADSRITWTENARPMTARELVLFTETEYSRPIDFHSWRRAFNQALADAGVNAQQAMALASHSSLQAHERYLRNTEKRRTIPTEALPAMGIVRFGHNRSGTRGELPAKTVGLGTAPIANEAQNPAFAAGEWIHKRCRRFESALRHKEKQARSRRDDPARKRCGHSSGYLVSTDSSRAHARSAPLVTKLASTPSTSLPTGVSNEVRRRQGAQAPEQLNV